MCCTYLAPREVLEESHFLTESYSDTVLVTLCELRVTEYEIAASHVYVGWILKPLKDPVGRKPRITPGTSVYVYGQPA
jgi:hypothetical protein